MIWEENMTIEKRKSSGPSRRTVIKGMGAAVAASTIAMPWVARAAGTIKVGVVSPASGPLALFGDAPCADHFHVVVHQAPRRARIV